MWQEAAQKRVSPQSPSPVSKGGRGGLEVSRGKAGAPYGAGGFPLPPPPAQIPVICT